MRLPLQLVETYQVEVENIPRPGANAADILANGLKLDLSALAIDKTYQSAANKNHVNTPLLAAAAGAAAAAAAAAPPAAAAAAAPPPPPAAPAPATPPPPYPDLLAQMIANLLGLDATHTGFKLLLECITKQQDSAHPFAQFLSEIRPNEQTKLDFVLSQNKAAQSLKTVKGADINLETLDPNLFQNKSLYKALQNLKAYLEGAEKPLKPFGTDAMMRAIEDARVK